jgi:hypothetical protein
VAALAVGADMPHNGADAAKDAIVEYPSPAGPLVLVKQTYVMREALILPGVVLKRR